MEAEQLVIDDTLLGHRKASQQREGDCERPQHAGRTEADGLRARSREDQQGQDGGRRECIQAVRRLATSTLVLHTLSIERCQATVESASRRPVAKLVSAH